MLKSNLKKNTLILTIAELIMEFASLFYNIYITDILGSSSIGIISLICSFFSFISIIANGNIFVCTSRYIAEEIGKDNKNTSSVFFSGIIFSLLLSLCISFLVFIFSTEIGKLFLKNNYTVFSIKILALCLPLNSLSSCIKGMFNAYCNTKIIAFSDITEFIIQACVSVFFLNEFVISEKMDLMTAISLSIFISQLLVFILLTFLFKFSYKNLIIFNLSDIKLKRFIKTILPLTINSYVTIILSSIHEALLPITLKQFSDSTELALSQYGLLKAIIMPSIYFPSVIIMSLSGILVPEISTAVGAKNNSKIKRIIEKSIEYTIFYAFFSVNIMFICGDEIGAFLSNGNDFTGKMIKLFAFVIPFIYLEIILESIIKAIGLQDFSTFNYIIEYVIRISVLLISVQLIGFYGIIISYYISNIYSNIARLIIITKRTDFSFRIYDYFIIPVLSILLSCQLSQILCCAITNPFFYIVVYAIISAAIYVLIVLIIKKYQGVFQPPDRISNKFMSRL